FFFFSSRRRHTRLQGDWSSDVCSSDLDLSATGLHKELRLTCEGRARRVAELVAELPDEPWLIWCNTNYEADALKAIVPGVVEVRSEERRVGKECRCGWSR